MKKITKALALFLTVIVMLSSFGIMSGAISSKSTAKELLDYYEDCIITTSAKEDVVKTNEVYKYKDYADYSSLKGEDLEATKADNEEWEMFENKWYEDSWTTYFFCDAYEEYYSEGRSHFIDYFSIKRDIRRYALDFESVKYSEAQNGDVTITFVYDYNDEVDENYTSTWTYTVKINKNGYLKSYSIKVASKDTEYSIENNPYTVTYERVDTFSFVYSKVDVKDIELSENDIVLGKDEECYVTVTIKPDDATFKDIYINYDSMDWDIADCYVEEDGSILVYAMGPGETTFDVCSYTGGVIETVKVTVEYTFFERIIDFFADVIYEIRWFFFTVFFGF